MSTPFMTSLLFNPTQINKMAVMGRKGQKLRVPDDIGHQRRRSTRDHFLIAYGLDFEQIFVNKNYSAFYLNSNI